jgi:hypothetical protein
MTALSFEQDDLALLDVDALAALKRFDQDAQALCAASSAQGAAALDNLRRRATAAYRVALSADAGPADRTWYLFIRRVAELVSASVAASNPRASGAAARLRGIVEENADLLPAMTLMPR